MCRADVFDYDTNDILRAEAKEKKTIQLIICGDFCQLPPVVTNADAECLSSKYDGFYAFESASWEMFDLQKMCYKFAAKTHMLVCGIKAAFLQLDNNIE